MSAAAEQRRERSATAHDQRARALGPSDLVRGDHQVVGLERLGVDRHLARALDGVAQETRAASMRPRGRLRHRLERSGLVVGEHQGEQHGVLRKAIEAGGVEHAPAIHRQVLDPEPLLVQHLRGAVHRMMLDGGDRDGAAAVAHRPGAAYQREMIALGPPTHEHHLGGTRAHERGHLLTGALHRGAGALPLAMQARGVAVEIAQARLHGRRHFRADRSGCIVVQVDQARSSDRDDEREVSYRRHARGSAARADHIPMNFCRTSMLSRALAASGESGAISTTFFHIRIASR